MCYLEYYKKKLTYFCFLGPRTSHFQKFAAEKDNTAQCETGGA
jgi:hypothetical protein